MKKILTAVVLVMAMLLSLVACGKAEEKTESSKEPEASSVEEAAEQEPATEAAESSEAESEAAEESAEPEAPEEPDPIVVIEEQVLYDQDGMKITVRSSGDPTGGTPIFAIDCENQTDHRLCFICKDVSLNGYFYEDGYASVDVEAGNTGQDVLRFEATPDLEYLGITPERIGEVEASFYVTDMETNASLLELPARIQTAAYEAMEVISIEDGTVLYDQDGLRVTGKYVEEDSLLGTAIVLFVENATDQAVTISPYYYEFNGTEVRADITWTKCFAESMKLCVFPIDPAVLAENGIETVDMVRIGIGIESEWGELIADLQQRYILEPAANPGHLSDASAFADFDTCIFPSYDEENYDFIENEVVMGQTLVKDVYAGGAAKTLQEADDTHESIEGPDTLEPGATGVYVADVFSSPLPDTLVFYVYNPTDAPAAFEDCVIFGIYNVNLRFANGVESKVFDEQPAEEVIGPILGEPYDIREEPVNEMITDTTYHWKDEDDQYSLKIKVRTWDFKDEDRQMSELSSLEYINRAAVRK